MNKKKSYINQNARLPDVPKDIITKFCANKNILFGYRGSIAHGMYVPRTDPNSVDDIDCIGVYIAPVEHYLGLGRKEHAELMEPPYDVISYELRKFVNLLIKGNPNVLSMLWMPDKYIVSANVFGRRLRLNRDLFISKQFYYMFEGYALSQKRRMTRISGRSNLGAKRKALVEQHGYDTKNAAHTVRLLRMGIEFLGGRGLLVDRSSIDADELIDIKLGKKSLRDVTRMIDRLFLDLDNAYACSSLPDRVDQDAVESMLVEILSQHFRSENLQ